MTLIDKLISEHNQAVQYLEESFEKDGFLAGMKNAVKIAKNHSDWVSVDDELPTQSDQYWVAYRPISNYNPNEKTTEICYCIAHFDSYDKIWSVKDQLFYNQRRCKVLFWQPLPNPPRE